MATGSKDWKQAAPQKSLLQLLREGNAYAGHALVAAVAGEYNFVQLYNPVDSGVELYLHGMSLGISQNGTVYVTPYDTLASNTVADAIENRKIGAVDSVAQIRYDSKAAATAFYYYGQRLTALLYEYIDYLNIWVPEGEKATIEISPVNTLVGITLTWFEFIDY